MHLLIDDMRNMDGVDVIVRTFDAAKTILVATDGWSQDGKSIWDSFILDHDLGCGDGKDGYDLLKWMYDFRIKLPNVISLVTSNPVGRSRMESLLSNMGYHKDIQHFGRFVR